MTSGAENDREVIRDQTKQAKAQAERLRRLRATAVRLDSQPRLLEATRWLRHRLPGDEKFGDPLSTAGGKPVHVVARGAPWALRAGDAAALELLREVGLCVEKVILAHQGRVVKRLGDGLMATFLDARAAVEAALECQERLRQIEINGFRPQMRVGIHWGRPRKLGDDYLGVDVNVAARVADAAKADQVLVSDAVLERIDLDGINSSRPHRLKAEGAPRSLQIIRLSRD